MRKPAPPIQTWLIVAGLALMTLAVYWPVRHHDFIQYDDQDYVTNNTIVQRGLTFDGVRWAFTQGHAANWHPLTWLSHMLDCQFFGLSPGGHHLVNVLFHALNAVLVFLLLRSLTQSAWRSACVAGLFALHPLHVESVAWVAERKDVLSMCFGLLALHAYSAYARCGGENRSAKRVYFALTLTLFALGLMSKPMLVTLPFLMLLLDWWPLQRLSLDRSFVADAGRLLLEKFPLFALSVASSFITMQVQQAGMMFYANLPLASRMANAVVSLPRYLGKTFWPQDLAVLYPHPVAWPIWQIVGAAGLIVALTALAVWQWRTRPYLAVGWFWFLGTLVPVLGFVQVGVQSMADRYTYLPLIGVFIMLVWAAADWVQARRWPAGVVPSLATVVLLLCALLTRWQLRVWASTESLFTHATRVTPDNWVAHYNLALHAMQRYQDEHRGEIANQAIASPPAQDPAGRDYLGEIIRHCEIVLQIKPGFPDPRITLAKALTERGEIDSARQELTAALALVPDHADARQNLAEVYLRQHQTERALAEYQRALELKPDWPEVLNNVAWLRATSAEAEIRNGVEAVRLAQRACELSNHTNLWFLHTLAAAYAETGDFASATGTARLALKRAQLLGSLRLVETANHRLHRYQSGQRLRDLPATNSVNQ